MDSSSSKTTPEAADADAFAEPSAALTRRPAFQAYLGCLATFWLPGGIMAVLVPWLVAVQLAAPAEQLGLAQMALQLPTLGGVGGMDVTREHHEPLDRWRGFGPDG